MILSQVVNISPGGDVNRSRKENRRIKVGRLFCGHIGVLGREMSAESRFSRSSSKAPPPFCDGLFVTRIGSRNIHRRVEGMKKVLKGTHH